MTSIIEKRLSLHQRLTSQQEENNDLKSQMSQLQALANLGTAASMIAHEINNLLTPLESYAELALKNLDDKPLTEKALKKAAQNAMQASKIMESILALANGQTQEKKTTPLLPLIEEIFTCLCRDFAKDGITVKVRIPAALMVWAVPVQIQQVLMNLVLNARHAMLPHGGTLKIKAVEQIDMVQIQVTDTGCGIKPNDLKNIFESFFTTKADDKSSSSCSGAGLGLAFCRKIVDAHAGSISVESKPSDGTTFTITLPKPQAGNS